MKFRSVLFMTVLLSMVSGCAKKDAGDPAIAETVKGYCDAIIRSYSELKSEPMHEFATGAEAGRIELIVWQFKGKKMFMESELKSLTVVNSVIKDDGETAEAETVEKWRYRHISLDSKEVVKDWKDEEYRIRYELVLEEGRWLVNKTSFIE